VFLSPSEALIFHPPPYFFYRLLERTVRSRGAIFVLHSRTRRTSPLRLLMVNCSTAILLPFPVAMGLGVPCKHRRVKKRGAWNLSPRHAPLPFCTPLPSVFFPPVCSHLLFLFFIRGRRACVFCFCRPVVFPSPFSCCFISICGMAITLRHESPFCDPQQPRSAVF